jgi:hypothetical protein
MNSQNPVIPSDLATDNPEFSLRQGWAEAARHFTATMYLMWMPTGSGAIPIPLGSLNVNTPWDFSGDAINTLCVQNGVNGTTWITSFNGLPQTPVFQPSQPNTDPN